MTVFAAQAKNYEVASPSGDLRAVVSVTNSGTTLSVFAGETEVLAPSPISITIKENNESRTKVLWGMNSKQPKVRRSFVDEMIPAPVYKRFQVKDRYNQMVLTSGKQGLVVRAYDDGIAYRLTYKSNIPYTVYNEQADFTFPADYPMYASYVKRGDDGDFESQYINSFENTYEHESITKFKSSRLLFLPVLVELPHGMKVCITEADLDNYPGMYLVGGGDTPVLASHFAPVPKTTVQGGHNMLQKFVTSREEYIARDANAQLPWRVIAVAGNDAELAASDIVFRLGKPLRIADTSWIKPGKVAWDWWNAWNLYGVDFRAGINNETYKYYIDFAAENGIEYVILDEGWAVNKKADLMQVVPEIDLPELVTYADGKNVGLILWTGYWAFHRDMENVVKHYADMGIKGFKVDFMDRDDQEMVRFINEASELCACYNMLVDFHGMYKPTGAQRTWPNVINYEGVNGLEQLKWSPKGYDQVTYDVQIPFIRQFAGPMDYTQGAMRNAIKKNYNPVNSEPMSQGTRCRQLATYVIFDSPLNMLCDNPSNYRREPECTAFIARIPTVWDETLGLDGKVGEYITMARRSGDEWYVGGLTNWDKRDIIVDLSFLEEGFYEIELFKDGINADRAACDYKRVVMPVPEDRQLKVTLFPGGGFAGRIERR
ncbi:MAG TPA: Retaining alpha-galactosidase [Barnesiella intestinihominis]|nr:glycoside hydrolase family 97 protein [Barnesiella intestinihominis]MDB0674921.1 glycoside hydrolase family 97 protein [Barnesiella intestinihominis]HAC12405.1 Retaining alpha-galactosidase [Barnesiella intestinihominis]